MSRSGLIREMIKEEWRTHSTLYKGRNFAFFPVMMFLITFAFAYATTNYSTLGPEPVGTAITIISAFLGLAVGNLGFSSRDAMKNVLGDTNFLVYSSRTLPVSKKTLLTDFIIKDLIYYTVMFLLPIALGGLLGTGYQIFSNIALILPLFTAGIIASFILARVSIERPSLSILNFERIERLEPMADKSLIDLLRSSGGIMKVLFSLGLLTAFYWYVVLYFPVTQVLLNNPLISYSVMIGLLNLTVYNWLNRFDSLGDYLHLPLDKRRILTGKEEAYMAVSIPLTVALISISYLFYPQHYFIALATGIAMTLYNLAVAIYTTGIEPNTKLFDTWVFIKYMMLQNIVAAPLLVLSVVYSIQIQWIYMGILSFAVISSLVYLHFRDTGRDRF